MGICIIVYSCTYICSVQLYVIYTHLVGWFCHQQTVMGSVLMATRSLLHHWYYGYTHSLTLTLVHVVAAAITKERRVLPRVSLCAAYLYNLVRREMNITANKGACLV